MAYNSDKRIIDLNASGEFENDDYIYVDSLSNGSRKYPASNLSALLPLTVDDGKLCIIYEDGN